jgi:hypothetical protein
MVAVSRYCNGMESTATNIPLTVAGIRNAIREHHLAGVEWIEAGVRFGGDGEPTWNATDWLCDADGDWTADLYELMPLRDVLRSLRAGHAGPVELDLYCYRQNGRGIYAEVDLIGNVELTIDSDGIITINGCVAEEAAR